MLTPSVYHDGHRGADMTRAIRLVAAGLLVAGVGVGVAAKPAEERPEPAGGGDKIAAAHAERVSKLADLTVCLDERAKAGIARTQTVVLMRAKLHQAKAEAAATDAERLAMLRSALESLKEADAMGKAAMAADAFGSAGPSLSDYVTHATQVIQQTAEVKIAIAKLEAKSAGRVVAAGN